MGTVRTQRNRVHRTKASSSGGAPAHAPSRKRRAEKFKIEGIWGKELIDGLGFTALPWIVLERQSDLGLDAVDITILLHLASFWRTRDNPPWPSKGTLAARMSVTPRTIQRHTAKLEAKGYLARVEKKRPHGGTQSNTYDLRGLIEAARPFADSTRQRKREAAAIGSRGRIVARGEDSDE